MEKQPGKGRIRRVLRIVIPFIMLSAGAVTVAFGGTKALIALLPILAIHVAVAAIAVPLWVRYRRRREAARLSDGE